MLPDIYWISRVRPARLAMMPRPRSGDWLADEVAGWSLVDIGTVVSLLEPKEVRELGLSDERALCQEKGIEFLSFALPDRGTPKSVRETAAFVEGLLSRLRGGTAVAIHCRAGIGRSGLICGCVLLGLGVPPVEVFPALTQARGVPVPDTPGQAAWLDAYFRERSHAPTRSTGPPASFSCEFPPRFALRRPLTFNVKHRNHPMRGHCLCGQVEFEIDGEHLKLYQCHCSLCRRQGGSLSNAATIIPNGKFRWLRGAELISSWQKESGFRSDFCSTCGSPVPNPLRNLPYFWVPAGLLESNGGLEVVAHLCVASKASWDSTPLHGACYDELPNLSEFIALLQAPDAS